MKEFTTVDEYITAAAEVAKPKLKEIREIITRFTPNAEERISYGMPGYFQNGALVYFGGFKNHVSLFGAGAKLHEKFKEELVTFKTSKGTIQFPLNDPLPKALIKKLVTACIQENGVRKK